MNCPKCNGEVVVETKRIETRQTIPNKNGEWDDCDYENWSQSGIINHKVYCRNCKEEYNLDEDLNVVLN